MVERNKNARKPFANYVHEQVSVDPFAQASSAFEGMKDRDPRIDPQPGDVLLGHDGLRRQVFRRKGDTLRIGDATSNYRMRLDHWREWCEKSGAEAVSD